MIRFAVLLLILFVSAPVFSATPFIYSRCKATNDTLNITRDVVINGVVTNISRDFIGLNGHDVMPDVSNFLTDFSAPCDLMHRDAAGVDTVIYDCSTNGTTPGQPTCAALDGAMSFDGDEVTYTVFRGTAYNYQKRVYNQTLHPDADPLSDITTNEILPNIHISTSGSHLRTHRISTGVSFDLTPDTPGIYDSGPAYVATGPTAHKIGFTSTRAGHTTAITFRTFQSKVGSSMFSVQPDGSNIVQDTFSNRTIVQHPLQLANGTIAYSSWQNGFGQQSRKGNGLNLLVRTLDNSFQIWGQDPSGSNNFPLFGQHSKATGTMLHGEDTLASHNLAQTTDGRIWFADYYRRNNSGLGVLIGFIQEPPGREGLDPLTTDVNNLFAPHDSMNFAPWSTNRDNAAKIVSNYPTNFNTHSLYAGRLPYSGKIGFPFAFPSNQLGMSMGLGLTCGIVVSAEPLTNLGISPVEPGTDGAFGGVVINNTTRVSEELIANGFSGDVPGCTIGLYLASVVPSLDVSDLTELLVSKDWHFIYARAAVPYSEIHGIPRPATKLTPSSPDLPIGSPYGMIGAASTTDRETFPKEGIGSDPFDQNALEQFHQQGTDLINYVDADVCGVRIMNHLPNDKVNSSDEVFNQQGERVRILGDVYAKHTQGNGDPVLDPSGNQDTSFFIRMPAGVSYTMGGIDCNGNLLNIDQTWQHLRPGELKTCGGCHVHSRDSRITFNESVAGQTGFVPTVFGEGTVQLLTGVDGNGDPIYRNETGYGYVPDYYLDIAPIFQTRCASCHSTNGLQEASLVLDDFTTQTNKPNLPSETSTYWRLIRDNDQSFLAGTPYRFGTDTYIIKPWITKYVKGWNPLGSLLYWKAANQRTDNRLDSDFADDIDFGADHPTAITSEELHTLGLWLSLGTPAGLGERVDTQKPTLAISPTVNGSDEITALNIGTVDIGDGIDVNTLNVCLRSGPTCANLATTAALHGITTINLTPAVSDPDQIIEASVNDMAGNNTTVINTAGFLITGSSSGSGIPSLVSVNAGNDTNVTVGDTFSRTVTFLDGEDTNSDGWTVAVDWNGVTENINVAAGLSSFNISRPMPTVGSIPVTVTITDDVGETAQGSFTITVNSSGGGGPLVINTGGDAIVDEGTTLTRTISIIDPTDTGNDGHTYVANWGGQHIHNGSIPAGATSFDISWFTPDGDAVMTVDVTVTDVVGDVSSGSFNLTTLNVDPTAEITSSGTASVGVPYNLQHTITDPGNDPILLTSVIWGDGTMNNETSHIYTQPGEYLLKIQVVQQDGVFTVARKIITVQ